MLHIQFFYTELYKNPTKKNTESNDFVSSDMKTSGLIIVGAYVLKSLIQLDFFLRSFAKENSIETDVNQVLEDKTSTYIIKAIVKIENNLSKGNDTIIYSGIKVIKGEKPKECTQIAAKISGVFISLIKWILSIQPKYIISKGGIVSHNIISLTKALGMKRAKVLEQITQGVRVCEMDVTTKFLKIPYTVFLSTVGNEKSLHSIIQKLNQYEYTF